MDVKRFLAIDAGGSKTEYVVGDVSRELGRVRSGSIKRMRVDDATAARHLHWALIELAASSGISMHSISRTVVGTAGETVPLVVDWLRSSLPRHISGEIEIVGDVEIALDAAFHGAPGVLVLAGTGSNVAARLHDGSMCTAGGWGPVLADQGSGHGIGRRAVRAICVAHDRQRQTALTEAVLEFWQLSSLAALVEYVHRTPSPDLARLTVPVYECARAGDEVADEVLQYEGRQLGELACVLLERLAGSVPAGPLRLAFAGSILEHIEPVRVAVTAAVLCRFPETHLLAGVVDPVSGALWRARRSSPDFAALSRNSPTL